MKVTIENLGPIRSASIDLNDLTIFVGPNNSGKSLLATTLYAFRQPLGSGALSFPLKRSPVGPNDPLWGAARQIEDFLREELIDGPPPYDALPVGIQESFARLVRIVLSERGRLVVRELVRLHGVDLVGLLRSISSGPTEHLSITLATGEPAWSLKILAAEGSDPQITVDPPEPAILWACCGATRLRSLDYLPKAFANQLGTAPSLGSTESFLSDLMSDIDLLCFREILRFPRYLPAARSGLMHAHRALAASMIQRATLTGREEPRTPVMTGVVADFLTELVRLGADRLSRQDAPSVGVAEALEREVLHGKVTLDPNPAGYPEVLYEDGVGWYPLIRTSSMISELAPVVLYLRYLLDANDLLILEEPEAHLHPANQVAFARNIVRLVNGGNPTLLTTHSEFFLEQLNNSIVAHTLGERARQRGYEEQTTIAHDKVSAYLFEPSPDGTRVRRLDVTPTSGIEPVGFEEVEEALYSDSVGLAEELDRAGE